MKKYLKYLLIISIFSLFQNCGKHSNKNDLQKNNLKGDVIGLKEGDFFYFYNDKGNIVKEFFNIDNKVASVIDYIYNDEKLDKVIQKVQDKDLIKTCSYDDKGRLILETEDEPDDKTYHYHNYNDNLLIQDSSIYITTTNGKEKYFTNIVNYFYSNGNLNYTESYWLDKENNKNKQTFVDGRLIKIEYDSKIFTYKYKND